MRKHAEVVGHNKRDARQILQSIVRQIAAQRRINRHRVNGVFSEAFPTHTLAHEAAERAAREQLLAGETTIISYEDSDGHWHEEVAAGDDRPETSVKD
jgi:hypothetical protein